MNIAQITARLDATNARVGQYVVLDPAYRVVRIDSYIGSFAAMTCRRTATGWERVS